MKTFLTTGNKPFKRWKFKNWLAQVIGNLICGTSSLSQFKRPQLLYYDLVYYGAQNEFVAKIQKTWCRWHDQLYRLGKIYLTWNVVVSMPERIKHGIRKRGGHTGYRLTRKYSFKTCFYAFQNTFPLFCKLVYYLFFSTIFITTQEKIHNTGFLEAFWNCGYSWLSCNLSGLTILCSLCIRVKRWHQYIVFRTKNFNEEQLIQFEILERTHIQYQV